MFCSHCGKKIEGGNFCSYCGMKAENSSVSGGPAAGGSLSHKTSLQPKSKKGLAAIAIIAAVVIVILILTERKPETIPMPYNINPYVNPYGGYSNILPPADFSDGFSDDTFDYGGIGSVQTCISCYGSGSCSICKGTGQYSMYGNELSVCTACYGTGICTICDGDGQY
ncbi:MAG: hypothetical protein BWY11_00361 [Firmicutes bacterium ADurb.Bin182]|nr:MAG: hypothetical protein BWY11_00361 [Firmicutes bacterium ADurb.Bin182]